ncbi:hypothetical protein K3495_g17346, partial [Podosphaera aphanis]
MALFGKVHGSDEKSGSGNQDKIKNKSKPFHCKFCGNRKARHLKGKCFEDPKNKDLRKQWEIKNNKKWKNFNDLKNSNNNKGKAKADADDDDSETPRFGGLSCINLSGLVAKNSDRWLPDTGASSHIANCLDKFDSYVEVKDLPQIATASGLVKPRGLGTVTLQCRLSNGKN